MRSCYGNLVGFTEGEIKQYLSGHVKKVAEKTNRTTDEIFKEMKEWYNGYRFSKKSQLVYNPWSVLNYLATHEIGNYWIESGSLSFAIKVLKKKEGQVFKTLEEGLKNQIYEDKNQLAGRFEIEDLIHCPNILLFQTGYLTIRDFNDSFSYNLGFPNKEVKESFFYSLLPHITNKNQSEINRLKREMKKSPDS